MELIKHSFASRLKSLSHNVSEHNLFMLSSSISYYSALAIAPFMLILLAVASFLGEGTQGQIVKHANQTMSPQVGQMIGMIFQNVNKGINVGSFSGIVGLFILLSTASLVFLQFRYSFDVIYGTLNPGATRSTFDIIKEKLFSMAVVLSVAILFLGSIFATAYIQHFIPKVHNKFISEFGLFIVNFLIYVILFTGVHFFTPSVRPKLIHCFKIAVLTSFFFVLGNLILSVYLKHVASGSIYGAAGTLLIFLTWAYYSSFTVFLSVEVFNYLKKIGKIK